MIQGIYSSASGMVAHQARIDTLANNLANLGTAGFKADFIAIDVSAPAGEDVSGITVSQSSVHPGRGGIDTSQGVVRSTENPLDLAILGSGLFVVQTPQGERYTRAGNFTRSADGFLTTAEGFRVLGSSGPIRVPDGGLVLGANGTLQSGERLRIVDGPGGKELKKDGANLFAPVEDGSAPKELPTPSVVQGNLENSNVNVALTMVEMLAAMRNYEAYQKTVQALDQTVGQANGELGRV
jgi:flagellar basal-body rod protein FlgG